MTHKRHWLKDLGATQYVKRAAIRLNKCSVSYSITSSARASTVGGIESPSGFAVLSDHHFVFDRRFAPASQPLLALRTTPSRHRESIASTVCNGGFSGIPLRIGQ
jgi:hypothetical protein